MICETILEEVKSELQKGRTTRSSPPDSSRPATDHLQVIELNSTSRYHALKSLDAWKEFEDKPIADDNVTVVVDIGSRGAPEALTQRRRKPCGGGVG